MKLKSLDRIDRLMNEGHVENIYIDAWEGYFLLKRIRELFGNRVEIITISGGVNKIYFKPRSLLLVSEHAVITSKCSREMIDKARGTNTYIKILTEDIFD